MVVKTSARLFLTVGLLLGVGCTGGRNGSSQTATPGDSTRGQEPAEEPSACAGLFDADAPGTLPDWGAIACPELASNVCALFSTKTRSYPACFYTGDRAQCPQSGPCECGSTGAACVLRTIIDTIPCEL